MSNITVNGVTTLNTDAKFPNGALFDNNTSLKLIKELENWFPDKFSILDLGCAGGRFIFDCNSRGHTAVGLENSLTPRTDKRSPGFNNWLSLADKNLFNVDISEPFDIFLDDQPLKFDVITAWEVLEHIHPVRLNDTLQRIASFLKEGGMFLATISTVSGLFQEIEYHSTICNKYIWLDFILQKHFTLHPFPFSQCPRMDACPNLGIVDDSIAVMCTL